MKKRSFYVIGLVILLLALSALNLTSCNSKPLSVSAKEGEAANGFTWENNYSEITITGYVGSSNSPTMPSYINDKPVTRIKYHAFKDFETMTSIKLSENLQVIEGAAFLNCKNLKSITFPDSVHTIEYSAFTHCYSLTSFTFPKGVTEIENCVLNGCSGITSIVIPDSVTVIYHRGFGYLDNLKTIYYTGTKAQWEKIEVMGDNSILETVNMVYNYTK